ncbi:MAG: amidohydrolase family protein [Acidobacteriota bacterium]
MNRSFFRSAALCAMAMAAAVCPAAVTVLENVTLIDGTGRAPVADASIIITDGRITYAGPKAQAKVPANAARVNLTGKFVVPGIINLHGHLGATKGLVQDNKNYTRENTFHQLQTYANYGVTSVMSMGSDQPLILDIRREQRATGRPKETRVFTAFRGFTGPGGYPTKAPGMKGVPYEVSTPAQVEKDLDELSAAKVDMVKVWVDDHLGKEQKIPLDLVKVIIAGAKKRGLNTAAHIFYYGDAKTLAEAGLHGLAHSVRDKEVDAPFIASMKKSGCWQAAATLTRELSMFVYAQPPKWLDDPFFAPSVTPDMIKTFKNEAYQKGVLANPENMEYKGFLKTAQKNLKKLADAGVPFGFGTDTGPPTRIQGFFEHLEMQLMAEAGLTPQQIITSWSKSAAQWLGASKDLGTVEAGHWADLVVTAKNPVANINNMRTIEQVYIGGNRVK